MKSARTNHAAEGLEAEVEAFIKQVHGDIQDARAKMSDEEVEKADREAETILKAARITAGSVLLKMAQTGNYQVVNWQELKRYQGLQQSHCLGCGAWLCVTAGAYSGEIECDKCGAANVFEDSSSPLRVASTH